MAGLSMKGGRKDNFFFCLLDHFEESDRWFLKSLLQVKDDEEVENGDDAIRAWIEKFQIDNLVIDFPLSKPACHDCKLDCPGIGKCSVSEIEFVREETSRIIKLDQELFEKHPKEYERERNEVDLINYSRDIFEKWPVDNLLTRPFKRRLKKGFLPYWNRSLDFWVWCFYHDQLLNIFNQSFDSFGNTSLMVDSRFSYMKRHFPKRLSMHEAHINLTLIELIRSKVITLKDIKNTTDLELGIEAKVNIIKKIEKKLNIFIYEHDLEVLVRNQRAFDSFLLAIAGQRKLINQTVKLPTWTKPEATHFILPVF